MSVLQVSNSAKERLLQILSGNRSLLVSINSGGCNGFSYSFETPSDEPSDAVIVLEHPKVYVANNAIEMIDGSILEYEQNDIGTSFFAITNPNATSKCGCGNSFSTF